MTRNSRIAVAILIAIGIAISVSLKLDTNNSSLTLRGDFPAFFAAGSIALSGEGARLYEEQLQSDIENHHWPSLEGRYYSFAYPPYVAVLLSPFALLPPLFAKALFTLLMLGALWFTVKYLLQIRGELSSEPLVLFAVLLCCAPVFISILAAQNVSLSMLLFTVMLWSTRLPDDRRAIILGLSAGIWAFKPQYSVIALFVLFLAGEIRAVYWAMIPLGIYYLLGVLLLGPLWPVEWLSAVALFAERDFAANQHQMISLLGFSRALFSCFSLPSSGLDVAISVLGLILILQTGWVAFRLRNCQELEKRQDALLLLIAVIGPLTVLVSPHSLFYELGVCAVALAVSLKSIPNKSTILLIWAALALGCYLHESLAVDLLLVFAISSYFLVYTRAKRCGDLVVGH